MKKAIIIILLIIIAFALGILFNKVILTGRAIENTNSENTFTKAVCNEKNQCIDLKVYCKDGIAVKIEPTSELIQMPENWIDPRTEKRILCN